MRYLYGFLFVSVIMCLPACNNTSSGSFRLEGFAENVKDSGNMILYYSTLKNNEWQEIVDTAKIINGKFLFQGNINGVTAADLVFDDTVSIVVIDARLYLEPTTMKLHIDKSRPYAYELSGTKVEKENIELRKVLEPDEKMQYEFGKYMDRILGQINLNSDNIPVRDSLINNLNQRRTEYRAGYKMDNKMLDFIKEHTTYQIVPDLLNMLIRSDSIPIDTVKHYYNNLPEKTKTSLPGKFLYKQIEKQEEQLKNKENKKDTLLGTSAPDFTRKDFFGKTVRLSDYRNKSFVLLDFWASWCEPCLLSIPKVKELYDKYTEKGLVIISISFDTDSISWSKAINNHQLKSWFQILNIENKNNSALNKDTISTKLNVELIPHFVLINKQGKIILNGVGEEQLSEIEKTLKNNFSDGQ